MINIKYKILFHVRFPTLHLLREEEIKKNLSQKVQKLQKILANSIKNTDVLFELSDVKIDTSNAVLLLMNFLKKDIQRVMLLKEF